MPADHKELQRDQDLRMAWYKMQNAEDTNYTMTQTQAGTALPSTRYSGAKVTLSLYEHKGHCSQTVLSPMPT